MRTLAETDYVEILERLRWGGVVLSPFDASSKVYKCTHGEYKCKATGRYFNVKTRTIFHHSRISLQQWFHAIEILSDNSSILATRLATDLGVGVKAAAAMKKKIIKAFDFKDAPKSVNEIGVVISPDKLPMADWVKFLKGNNA